jgi:hypothetical protein
MTPTSSSTGSLHELSSRVAESAYRTGFALMKANYVQRGAPELPGGKIEGLRPEARDIAVSLRDSISARFDSLRFHYLVMERLQQGQHDAPGAKRPIAEESRQILSVVRHAHYLFDDVVFNAASLFDYLGNAVWFGFHGQNHVKKKWSKVYEASHRHDLESRLPKGPRIFGSKTGGLIERVHREFVDDLYGYRSDLIHYRQDQPNVYSHRFWEDVTNFGLRVSLPPEYARRFRRLIPDLTSSNEAGQMMAGATSLIIRIGNITLELLELLRNDLNWTDGDALTFLG